MSRGWGGLRYAGSMPARSLQTWIELRCDHTLMLPGDKDEYQPPHSKASCLPSTWRPQS